MPNTDYIVITDREGLCVALVCVKDLRLLLTFLRRSVFRQQGRARAINFALIISQTSHQRAIVLQPIKLLCHHNACNGNRIGTLLLCGKIEKCSARRLERLPRQSRPTNCASSSQGVVSYRRRKYSMLVSGRDRGCGVCLFCVFAFFFSSSHAEEEKREKRPARTNGRGFSGFKLIFALAAEQRRFSFRSRRVSVVQSEVWFSSPLFCTFCVFSLR